MRCHPFRLGDSVTRLTRMVDWLTTWSHLTGNIKKESDRYRPVPVKHKKRVPDGKAGSTAKGVTGTEPHNRHYVH